MGFLERNYAPIALWEIGGCGMKFPEIEKYISKNNISLRDFSKRCGMPVSTMSRIVNGKVDVQKSSIDKILKTTGMSYEECFKEGES